MKDFFGGLVDRESGPWAVYNPANVHGAKGLVPGYIFAPHAAFAGGNQGGGLLQTDPGTQPIIPSNAGTLAAGAAGTAFSSTGLSTSAATGDWTKIVTALVVRNTIETLRDKAVFAQAGNQPLMATHVPGTNQFVYTGFADLSDAVELLEGVPPETEKMLFDTFSFTGKQVGKTTAITDLAEIFNPFDLYAKASEKLAWNAVNYVEKTLAALIASIPAIPGAALATGAAQGVIDLVTRAKRANVPQFADGTYHAFVSPETASIIMGQTGELGWTDAKKYQNPSDLMNGEVGTFRGIRFIETNRIAATPSVVYLFGPESYVCGDWQTIEAYRVSRGGDHADPLAQRAIMGWKGMMGYSLVAFDGTPVMGPATNTLGQKAFKGTLV